MTETDRGVIEMLDFLDEYYASWRFRQLKRENASLRGQLTRLKKHLNKQR